MSTENDIEKRIKDNFENHDFEIQDAWLEDMSSKLDDFNKKPNRKFGFWIFLLGGLLLSSAAGAYWYTSAHHSNENGRANSEHQNERIQENVSTQLIHNETENANDILNNQTNNDCYDEINSIHKSNNILNGNNSVINKNTDQNEFNDDLNAKNHPDNKNQIKQNTLGQNTSKGITQNNKNINSASSKNTFVETSADAQSKSSKTNTNNNLLASNQSANSNFSSIKTKNLNLSNEMLSTDKTLNTAKDAELKTSSSEKNLNSELTSETSKENKKEDIDSLQQAILEEKHSENEKEDSLDLKTSEDKKTEKNKKDLGLSLAINAGPSFLFRSFSSATQNEKRTSEELNKIGWNANIELYKTFRNKIIIGTGIQASNYGEKIAYSAVNTSLLDTSYTIIPKDYLNLNITRLVDSAGQNFYSYDTTSIIYNDSSLIVKDSTYLNSSVAKSNANSQFTYLEIPVLFGYKILDTKKFDIIASTGVSVGFLVHRKGFYLSPENELEPAISTSVNFNYLLNAKFNYQVYKNLSLSFAPTFRHNLNNQSNLAGTKQRYTTFGLNGGIILDF